jgi:PBP1b-binding outer membrane lipoprotein LpoB
MKKILPLALFTMLVFVGCTQTMTMVHTQGQAEDVVDETSSASPNVTPNIAPVVNLPVKAI